MYYPNKVGIQKATATITGVAPEAIITPASGYVLSITELLVANQQNAINSVTLYRDADPISPQIALPASGTLFWDEVGGRYFDLPASSGLKASLASAGSVDVTVFYILRDDRTPIAKYTARANSYNASLTSPKAIRTPNRFGNQ